MAGILPFASASFIFASIVGIHAQWSACDKSCGGGSQTRQSCIFGPNGPCSTIYRGCNTRPCVPGWGKWSPCSKSCGGGTRFKVDRCSDNDIYKCSKTYGDCNTQACKPLRSCGPGFTFRYNDRSDCCRVEKETCGVIDPLMARRVLGGTKAILGQWPWAAVIVKKATDTTHCGGNLLHTDWVLTAAHCLATFRKADLYVLLGSISIKFPAAISQKKEIAEFIVHEKYKYPLNDIGLIKLASPATISSVVKPVCLPSGEIVQPDTTCIVAGWGIAKPEDLPTNTPSDVMMQVGLRVLPLDACRVGLKREAAWEADFLTSDQHLCVGEFSLGKDSCRGDSGGPVVCQRCSTCGWYLAAITSFGAEFCGTIGVPAAYVNVAKYEYWIRQNVKLAYNNYYVC